MIPVFMVNRAGWLGLVLQSFPVDGISLFIHASLFKLPSPGNVKRSGSGADAFTENVTVERDGIPIITRL